jgi:uncharacterized membrane protein
MTNPFAFFRDRVLGGFLFILPLLAFLIIGRELLRFVAKIIHPLAVRLPTAGLTGPVADSMVAGLLILTLAFMMGWLASLNWTRGFTEGIENFAMVWIPGFALLQSWFQTPDTSKVKVLFVTLDEAWLFGFLIEELPDGILAVFIPGVPSPTSGSLYFFNESQVRRTDISVRHAVRCLTRMGIGSARFVTGRLPVDV